MAENSSVPRASRWASPVVLGLIVALVAHELGDGQREDRREIGDAREAVHDVGAAGRDVARERGGIAQRVERAPGSLRPRQATLGTGQVECGWANSVTSCPRSARPRASMSTMRSMPP